MQRTIIWLAIAILTFAAGYVVSSYDKLFNSKKIVTEEATILLEKINTVAKLITVEGEFADIYSYKDYNHFDMPFLSKKALLKVRAKVSVGYDLEKMTLQTFPEQRKLYISNLPKPEIISIEPEIVFYDLHQGTFNAFSEAELTDLNKKAIAHIRAQALQNQSLMKSAQTQGTEVIQLIEFMAKEAGWTVVYTNPSILDAPADSLNPIPLN